MQAIYLPYPKKIDRFPLPQLGTDVGRASSCVTTVDHVQDPDAQLDREHPEQHKQRLPIQETIPLKHPSHLNPSPGVMQLRGAMCEVDLNTFLPAANACHGTERGGFINNNVL